MGYGKSGLYDTGLKTYFRFVIVVFLISRNGKDVDSFSSTPKKLTSHSPKKNVSSKERINLSCLNKAQSSKEDKVEKQNDLSALNNAHSSKEMNDSKQIDIDDQDSPPVHKETGDGELGSDTKENIAQGQRRSPRKSCSTFVEYRFKSPAKQVDTVILKSPLKPLNQVRQSPRKTVNPFKREQIEELKLSDTPKGHHSPRLISTPVSSHSRVHPNMAGKVGEDTDCNLSNAQQGKVILALTEKQSDGQHHDKGRRMNERIVNKETEEKSIRYKVDVIHMEKKSLATCKRNRTAHHAPSDDFKEGLVQSTNNSDDTNCREVDPNVDDEIGSVSNMLDFDADVIERKTVSNVTSKEVISNGNTVVKSDRNQDNEQEMKKSKKNKQTLSKLPSHRKTKYHPDSSPQEGIMKRVDGGVKTEETLTNDRCNGVKVDKQLKSPHKISSCSKRKDDFSSSQDRTTMENTGKKPGIEENYPDKHLPSLKAGQLVRSQRTSQTYEKSVNNMCNPQKDYPVQKIGVKSDHAPTSMEKDEVVNSDVPTDFQSYGPQGELMTFSKTLAERIKDRGKRRSSVPSYNLNLISQTFSRSQCESWDSKVSKSLRKENKKLNTHQRISPKHCQNSAVVASKKICNKYRQKRNTKHGPDQLGAPSGYQGDDEGETKEDRRKKSPLSKRREKKTYWYYDVDPGSSSTNCDEEKLKSLPKKLQILQSPWNDVTDAIELNNTHTRRLRRSAMMLPNMCDDSDDEDTGSDIYMCPTASACAAKKDEGMKNTRPRRKVGKYDCTIVDSDADSSTGNEVKSSVKGRNALKNFDARKLEEKANSDPEDPPLDIDFTDSEYERDQIKSKKSRKTVRNTQMSKSEFRNKETSKRSGNTCKGKVHVSLVETEQKEDNIDGNLPQALKCLKSAWNNLADIKTTDNRRKFRSGSTNVNTDLFLDKEARGHTESGRKEEDDESILKELKYVKSSQNDVERPSSKYRSRSERVSVGNDSDFTGKMGKTDYDVRKYDHNKLSEEVDQLKSDNHGNERLGRKTSGPRKVYWEYVIDTESKSEGDDMSLPKMLRKLKSSWNNLNYVQDTNDRRRSRSMFPNISKNSEFQSSCLDVSNDVKSKSAETVSENKEEETVIDARLPESISNSENLVRNSQDDANEGKQQAKRQKKSEMYKQDNSHQDLWKPDKIEYKKTPVTADSFVISKKAAKNSKQNELKKKASEADVSSTLTEKGSQNEASILEINKRTEESNCNSPDLDDRTKGGRKSRTKEKFWEYIPVTSPDKTNVIDKNLKREILSLRDAWNNLLDHTSSEKSERLLRRKSRKPTSFMKRTSACISKMRTNGRGRQNKKVETCGRGDSDSRERDVCVLEEESELTKNSVVDAGLCLFSSDDKISCSETVAEYRTKSNINVIDVDNSKLEIPMKQPSPAVEFQKINIEKENTWNDKHVNKNNLCSMQDTEDRSETELDIRSSSPVFNKSPLSKIQKNYRVNENEITDNCLNEEGKRPRISKALRDKIKIYNEEPIMKPGPVIEVSPTKCLTPSKTKQYIIVSSPHSGYSASPRERRRRQWKRKAQHGMLDSSHSDSSVIEQRAKRRKLDKLKYVIDKDYSMISPKRSGKSSRKQGMLQDTRSPCLKTEQESFEICKANDDNNIALVNTNHNVSLKWQPATVHGETWQDNKKVKLNESWKLISDRSASKLLSSEDDKDSFTGFTEDDTNNSLPSDLSFEEHSEVDMDNTKYEWSVEDETGNKSFEDLSKLVPAFSSPGKPSEQDWELNIDSFMKNRVSAKKELCMSMTSPWRGSCGATNNMDKDSSVNCRRTPVKNKRQSFMNRINQVDNEDKGGKPDWERVDEDIDFNHNSPQKLCSDFSPLRSENGVIMCHSRENITSTPAMKQKKSKKSLDSSFSGLVFSYDEENTDDSSTDVRCRRQDYRLLKKTSDVKKSFSLKYDASPQKKPRMKKS